MKSVFCRMVCTRSSHESGAILSQVAFFWSHTRKLSIKFQTRQRRVYTVQWRERCSQELSMKLVLNFSDAFHSKVISMRRRSDGWGWSWGKSLALAASWRLCSILIICTSSLKRQEYVDMRGFKDLKQSHVLSDQQYNTRGRFSSSWFCSFLADLMPPGGRWLY